MLSREETYQLKYTIALIAEFAKKFHLGKKQAYNYIKRSMDSTTSRVSMMFCTHFFLRKPFEIYQLFAHAMAASSNIRTNDTLRHYLNLYLTIGDYRS